MQKIESKDIRKNSKAQIDADVYRFPPSRSRMQKKNRQVHSAQKKSNPKYLAKKSCKVDVVYQAVARQSTKQLQSHGHVLPHTPQHHHKEIFP